MRLGGAWWMSMSKRPLLQKVRAAASLFCTVTCKMLSTLPSVRQQVQLLRNLLLQQVGML